MTYQDHFIQTNNIRLHYADYPSDGPLLLLMHGLTANAHAFDGLVAAGLVPAFRLVSPDLRGRGLTDHPAFRYTLQEHAEDILGLLDHLGVEKVYLGGHSFGGLLSCYLAVHYPKRVEKLIILDAAAEMNPHVAEMLGPALSRLDKKYPSFDAFIEEMKKAPQNTIWDEHMRSYYEADVMPTEEGGVTPRPNLTNILEVSYHVGSIAWPALMGRITQTALLVNAPDNYTMDMPLLPDDKARETVELMQDARYVAVDGNHHTMLYADGARQIVKAIRKFLEV